jgi:hypothetical protein
MHEKLLSEYWNYSHLGFKIIGCLNKPSSFGKYPVAILHRIDRLKHFTILEVCRQNSQCHNYTFVNGQKKHSKIRPFKS